MIMRPIHISAGLLAIGAAYVALATAKGGLTHRRSGMVFVYAMLAMATTGATLSLLKSDGATALGGFVTPYFVLTGMLSGRRPGEHARRVDVALLALGVGLVATYLTFGVQAVLHPEARVYRPPLFFVFATILTLSSLGDARLLFGAPLRASQHRTRHLWRMCFASFIATGSFFLGQAKVLPKPMRVMPLLAIPALAPLVLMLYWLLKPPVVRAYRRVRGLVRATPARGAA